MTEGTNDLAKRLDLVEQDVQRIGGQLTDLRDGYVRLDEQVKGIREQNTSQHNKVLEVLEDIKKTTSPLGFLLGTPEQIKDDFSWVRHARLRAEKTSDGIWAAIIKNSVGAILALTAVGAALFFKGDKL